MKVKVCFLDCGTWLIHALTVEDDNELDIVLFIDAKYTAGMEKTFVKLGLLGAIFPQYHSTLERWVDVVGHEDELLDPLITNEILVSSP